MSDALDRLFNAPKLAASAAAPASVESETPLPVAPPTPPQTGLCTLPDDLLTDFPDQPFKPYIGDKLDVLRESVSANGIIEPLIVRPFGEPGHYQIISGHNRRRAGRLIGYTEFPCVVRELSDDEATLQLVETNLRRRDDLLPSEKAKAYRLRMEVLNHQGERTDLAGGSDFRQQKLAGGHDVPKSRDKIGAEVNISGRQVQRYIRLAYLIAPLLDLVD
ncbi:MAG: ParB/RepB/Spo0J family partition protein, partial [Oscillospiraceae bacterium]